MKLVCEVEDRGIAVRFLATMQILHLVNHLTPNGNFSGRTAPLNYRCCVFYLFNKYTY